MCPQSASSDGMSSLAASRMTRRWLIAALIGSAILAVIGTASLVVYLGAYDIAADTPHSQPVFWFMTTVRECSIAARAADVVVPSLSGGSLFCKLRTVARVLTT